MDTRCPALHLDIQPPEVQPCPEEAACYREGQDVEQPGEQGKPRHQGKHQHDASQYRDAYGPFHDLFLEEDWYFQYSLVIPPYLHSNWGQLGYGDKMGCVPPIWFEMSDFVVTSRPSRTSS